MKTVIFLAVILLLLPPLGARAEAEKTIPDAGDEQAVKPAGKEMPAEAAPKQDALAQDVEKLTSFVFSTLNEAERTAEVTALLDKNPALAKAKEGDEPILLWTLSNLGSGGELARKSRILAEMLVKKGADVNGADNSGMPLLIHFAIFAQVEPMEFLLTHGANPNAKDPEDNRTALHWVALLDEQSVDGPQIPRLVEQKLKAAELLIKAKAEIDAVDKRGVSPLHATAFLGNLKMTTYLLDQGANIHLKDKDGYSVLGSVLARGEETWATDKEKLALPPVIELLRQRGAKDERPPK